MQWVHQRLDIKSALNAMTKSLAHVLGPEIRINAVAPGPIKTRWLKGGMSDEAYDSLIDQAEKVFRSGKLHLQKTLQRFSFGF